MKIIKSPNQLNELLARERLHGRSVGFVPTMGALHAGHLSLVKTSNLENDVTVVSIFVNPTQFGPKEDYRKYPRTLAADKKLLHRFKVDYLFCPSTQAMYPQGYAKDVLQETGRWSLLARRLCGKFRPGHFQGVVTVMTKLLDIVGACRLYLGAKDYQQAVIINQLVKDLKMCVCVRILPTIREKNGLAMSSRNHYLGSKERERAAAISRVLKTLKTQVLALKKKASFFGLKRWARCELEKSVDQAQYFEIVDPLTLKPLKNFQPSMVALTACFVGKTRLIDNVIIIFPPGKKIRQSKKGFICGSSF